MKVYANRVSIGDRVRITSDVPMGNFTYTSGHEFVVTGSGPRGLDLVDDDGNQLTETLLIAHLIEPVKQ